MLRSVLSIAAILTLAAIPAFAFQDFCVLKVEKGVAADALWSMGFLYLADLGDAYLVEGDDRAVGRLSGAGARFSPITTVSRGEHVFLLRPHAAEADILFTKILFDLGDGTYLAKLRIERAEELESVRYDKALLTPRPFPEPGHTPPLKAETLVVPKPEIQAMVDAVDGDSLFKTISHLSGNEPVVIDGTLDTLLTRFTPTPDCEAAAVYLRERLESYGLDTETQEFWFGWLDFHSGDFVDTDHGWVISFQYLFGTEDGGLTWEARVPGGPGENLLGICFLDASRGWVVGTGACIYGTGDGGDTWTERYPPAGIDDLHTVAFHDSMAGWAAGNSGNIIRTADGGDTWSGVASGTSNHIYALHFQSETSGWACGQTGTIISWDGLSWSVQTSGTTEDLYDIKFLDDNLGWAVGAGRTVLKTTDGGLSWVALPVPVEATPYLYSVWFISADEGWVSGLSGTILHTTDGGTTWEFHDPGTLYYITHVEFVNASQGWAVGHGCTILKTSDGGLSWQSQSENLPEGTLSYAKNVIATLPGTVTEEQVIICGHYDSVTETDPMNLAPGADDNASGVSAVLEAAKLMRENSYERTTKFICFGAEEQWLRGSYVYAAGARRAGTEIAGVVNLDMIAYSDSRPEPADLVGNADSEWLVDFCIECAAAYVPTAPTRKVISAAIVGSDHSPFWDAGYYALFGHEDIPTVTPYRHTEGDTLGTLAKWFLTKFAKIGLATVAELATPDTTSGIAGTVLPTTGISASPNPFNSATTVSFVLGRDGEVSIEVFDVQGRRVRTLTSGLFCAGRHDVVWDGKQDSGTGVSPGIYFARVKSEANEATVKVILLN